jgi:hypothetical protein
MNFLQAKVQEIQAVQKTLFFPWIGVSRTLFEAMAFSERVLSGG